MIEITAQDVTAEIWALFDGTKPWMRVDSTCWDCAKQNVASKNLAKKLGFQRGHEYHYVIWAGHRI